MLISAISSGLVGERPGFDRGLCDGLGKLTDREVFGEGAPDAVGLASCGGAAGFWRID